MSTTNVSPMKPLLGSKVLDRTRPFFAALLSAAGWSNSWVTTTMAAIWLEQQLTVHGNATWVSWVVGITIAVTLTLGQIYTLGQSRGGYLFCLLPDVALTAVQHQRWLVPLIKFFFGDIIGFIGGWAGAITIGWFSARLPERIVFGRRHAKRRSRDNDEEQHE
jgi:uncharacterized membrane protein YedE/YeeE